MVRGQRLRHEQRNPPKQAEASCDSHIEMNVHSDVSLLLRRLSPVLTSWNSERPTGAGGMAYTVS